MQYCWYFWPQNLATFGTFDTFGHNSFPRQLRWISPTVSVFLYLGNNKGECGNSRSHHCRVGSGGPLCCSFAVLLPFSQSSGLPAHSWWAELRARAKKGRILKASLISFPYKMHMLAALAAASLQSMADGNCCTGGVSVCLLAGYLAVWALCCGCSFRISQLWPLLCLHPEPHRL